MNNTISIIVPAYNVESYIDICLESVIAQTYKDLEILLIDDGSSDNTLSVAKEAAKRDSRIRVFHQDNAGVTSARMLGLREMIGDWVGFVDGDDYIDPDMYERLLCNALKTGADISHCGYQKHYSDHIAQFGCTEKVAVSDQREGLKKLLSGKTEPGLWNKLYRRSLFYDILQNNRVDPTIKNTEDRLMNYYLFREAEKSVYEGFCPYHYIVRSGSATHPRIMDAKRRDPICVWEIILEETKNDPELFGKSLNNLVSDLIRASTLSKEEDRMLQTPFRKEARGKLGKWLFREIWNPYGRVKIKLLALWAWIWPELYRNVNLYYRNWKQRLKT